MARFLPCGWFIRGMEGVLLSDWLALIEILFAATRIRLHHQHHHLESRKKTVRTNIQTNEMIVMAKLNLNALNSFLELAPALGPGADQLAKSPF